MPQSIRTDLNKEDLDLVIVTGLSGGGRSTVARALENVSYYVVDNLPQSLVTTMAELAYESEGTVPRTALVLDVRSQAFSADFIDALQNLRLSGFTPRILFVDANDEELIRRFESVRRKHPLQGDGRLADGIAAERELLADTRGEADVVIDTTHLNVNQLRSRIENMFATDAVKLQVTVMSFGYKYGLPADSDYVVDMRFLPNPHWIPGLRARTGLYSAVRDYVLAQEGAVDFITSYAKIIGNTFSGYEREGKRYVTVAVGCTGGKHRSVASTEYLGELLREQGAEVKVLHRDMGRE